MKTDEALKIIGGSLSKPSKMPGWSIGLPAKECKTGWISVQPISMKFYIVMKTELLSSSGLITSGRKMSRRPGPAMARVYLQHWRWLQEQGPSYKHQAASLTRDLYCVIQSYKLKEKV